MYALFDTGGGLDRDAEKFNAVAEFGRGIEIGRRDRRNAFAIDRARINFGTEGDARQDDQLLRSIVPFDIEARIGLRIAQPLRFLQALGKAEPILFHPGEDIIAGAVEDTVDACEGRTIKSLAQRLDDGNAAGDRRFEIKSNVMSFRERGKPLALRGEQRLIGGDYRLAGGKRGFYRKLRGTGGAADHFDKHIDLGIARQRRRIADPTKPVGIEAPFLIARPGADRDHVDAAPTAGDQFLASAVQKLHDRTADSTEAGKTDFQRFSHVASPGLGGVRTRLPSRRERNDVVQQFRASFKKAPDIASCLTNTLLVFDKRDADVAFPVLAETRAG